MILTIAIGWTFVGSLLTALPVLVVELARLASADVVFHAETARPVVALSIDDGPSEATPEILRVLAEHDVHATFFVIGAHVETQPRLASAIVSAGHELGHHMMYDERSIGLPQDTFVQRFEQMDGKLRQLGGSRLFRPGSGWYDADMVAAVAARGYRTVLGSVYPFDAQLPFPRLASWYVLRQASPGAILVLHDGPERGIRTADVLRRVLPELRRRGYDVVPVSELLDLAGRE
jgi:peptidoglycan-N-acetylglucosamine deacetylase